MSFIAELRKANGDDYEPDSLMFSAIDRHLKSKSYPKSIRENNIFLPCHQVLEGKARKLRSERKGKRPHRAQSLNAEEERNFIGMWTAWDFHTRILNKYCLLVVNSTFWVKGTSATS